ncbi:JAB domain-containing protein [Bacillus sp. ISL-45]|uniref:JAB domain-containing protein n=1 Tax=Bacillus sp. ISL-45 TaxID=2819128 RepID=UPI001BE9F56D|nr:JAB domain-containing protein [Bacillus sp. ISL-45]MBT2663880.1 JAB domain-containing protein [Bacillus sp. ISL-45]
METIYEVSRIKQVVLEVQNKKFKKGIFNPSDANKIAHHFIGEDDRDVFLVICLNTKNQVIAVHRSHIGTLSNTTVSPREIFKACILNNARSFVVAHNHPSTNIKLSKEDFKTTEILLKAGLIHEIPLMDHLIVNSRGEFFSFKQEGYMFENRVVRRRVERKN